MKNKPKNKLIADFLFKNLHWAASTSFFLILSGYSRMETVANIKILIDKIDANDLSGFIPTLVIAVIFGFLSYFSSWASVCSCVYMGEKMARELRIKLFDKLNKIGFMKIEQFKKGDLQSLIRNDVQLGMGMFQRIATILSKVFNFAFCAYYLARLNLPVASVVIIICVIGGLFNQKILNKIKGFETASRKSYGKMTQILLEFYNASDVIKTYGASGFAEGVFFGERSSYNKNKMDSAKTDTNRLFIYNLVNNACLFVSVIYLSYGAIDGKLTVAELVAFIALIRQVLLPIETIFRQMSALMSNFAAWERVVKFLSSETEEYAAHEALHSAKSVQIEDINFSYDGVTDIIKNMSLQLNQGKSYALKGQSGGGKTTLMKILLGVYNPRTIKITVDGKEYPHSALQGLASYVPADNNLFNMSVYENITLGNNAVSKGKCLELFEGMGLRAWVESLPDGIDTIIDANAKNISGGQRQAICILRALVFDRPAIFMDEPFSALDKQREGDLTQIIDKLKQSKIVLFTSHRESTLGSSDETITI